MPGLRRVPVMKLLAAAELALLTRDHIQRLTPLERRRLITLVRVGRGRRTRLTGEERGELEHLLGKLEPRLGFHRLLTHRAFETRRWVRYTLAVLGSMSLQGPVIDWVADHRKHHAFSDHEGDPHSPWRYGVTACGGALTKGLGYAHVGWLFETHGQASSKRFARRPPRRPHDAADQQELPADRAVHAWPCRSCWASR